MTSINLSDVLTIIGLLFVGGGQVVGIVEDLFAELLALAGKPAGHVHETHPIGR